MAGLLDHLPPASTWTPHEIGGALGLLRDGRYEPGDGKTRSMATTNFLAEAWKPSRLTRCLELLDAGQKPPPVRAVAFRIGKRKLYEISDGNHRVIAARVRRRRIRAIISETVELRPAEHVIMNGVLWREDGARLAYVWEVNGVQAAILAAFGVRVRQSAPDMATAAEG